MVIYVVNTATAANPAATFMEERLEGIRKLFDSIPTYNITLRNARQETVEFLNTRGAQLTPHRLKCFLSFVASFSVVLVSKLKEQKIPTISCALIFQQLTLPSYHRDGNMFK